MSFKLDEQLANDTTPVGDLPLSSVLLMNDSRFPWAIIVPRREGLIELHDMIETDRNGLMSEAVAVSVALQKLTGASKMNIAALGNVVRQLHVHVIARNTDDDAWPRPVWGVGAPTPYNDDEARACAAALKAALGI
ncbi:MAG TPA: HIT domain-containing protein [Parvularculaceae bacterium]|nr:HIT domain-containing protein [Parvularculaceae bacterium]HNS85320.1 HIT domain-containing protein [Parvularculaceae bacterium]